MADAAKLKEENTRLLREALRFGACFGKNELARQTGLSFPTVSRIIDELTAAGEVKAVGAAASTGGRCAMQYTRDPAFRLFLCLRLEGEKLCWFISDMAGERLEQQAEDCQTGILPTIDTLLMRVRARYPRLAAAAFGLAGTLDRGTVTEAFGYPELRGVSLKTHLEHILHLPIAVSGDTFAAVGGYLARHKDSPRTVVCLYLGENGAGAGLAVNGTPFAGAREFAGELHFLPIRNNLEYAKNHFAGADMVAYYMQVIRAYAALVDPDRVVLYDNELLTGKVGRIRAACEKTLPPQAMPEIELSQEFEQDYEAGLSALARTQTEETL